MIGAAGFGLMLFLDHGVELNGCRIKHGLVGEGILEHENAGAGINRFSPFRHDGFGGQDPSPPPAPHLPDNETLD